MKYEVADGSNCPEVDEKLGRTIGIREKEDDLLWVAVMEGDWAQHDTRALAELFASAPELAEENAVLGKNYDTLLHAVFGKDIKRDEFTAEEVARAITGNLQEADFMGGIVADVQTALDMRCIDNPDKVGCSDLYGEEPKVAAALKAENVRLQSELAHMRKNAGTDSCADYAERNAELAAENTKLADALDTACNMLETVGSVALTFRAVGCKAGKTRIACENCGNDWDYDNPGNPDAHDAACDIPDVFRVRDEWKAAQERKRLEAELSGETPEPCGELESDDDS